jgi:hypothetical protein
MPGCLLLQSPVKQLLLLGHSCVQLLHPKQQILLVGVLVQPQVMHDSMSVRVVGRTRSINQASPIAGGTMVTLIAR